MMARQREGRWRGQVYSERNNMATTALTAPQILLSSFDRRISGLLGADEEGDSRRMISYLASCIHIRWRVIPRLQSGLVTRQD